MAKPIIIVRAPSCLEEQEKKDIYNIAEKILSEEYYVWIIFDNETDWNFEVVGN